MFWVMLVLLLFILQFGFVLFMEFRNPSKTTAWLLILFLFPGIGFLMYFFLAKEYRQRRMIKRRGKRKVTYSLPAHIFKRIQIASRSSHLRGKNIVQQQRLLGLLRSMPESPITMCNRTDIYAEGNETFAAMKETMRAAKDHIHFQFFIIHDDEIGRELQQILMERARAGVTVRVLYDGMGSYDLPGRYVQELKAAGVDVRCFLPLRSSFFKKSLNYRNHRKIVVVDGLTGYLGGINVGDEYLGRSERFGFWRDTHMKLEGDAVYFLQHTFVNDWAFVTGENLEDERYFPEHGCLGEEHVQIIASGPDAHWDNILEMYFGSISTAQNRIYIVTPYFIPDPSILMAIKTAALSGVDVKIILPGIVDHFIVRWGSLSYLEELMHAGVRFYLYRKGFVHAKILIVDETIASVGTANLDMRSFFDNFELNAALFDEETIARLVEDFDEDLTFSDEIRLSEFRKRSRWQRGKEVLARMLSPLL